MDLDMKILNHDRELIYDLSPRLKKDLLRSKKIVSVLPLLGGKKD